MGGKKRKIENQPKRWRVKRRRVLSFPRAFPRRKDDGVDYNDRSFFIIIILFPLSTGSCICNFFFSPFRPSLHSPPDDKLIANPRAINIVRRADRRGCRIFYLGRVLCVLSTATAAASGQRFRLRRCRPSVRRSVRRRAGLRLETRDWICYPIKRSPRTSGRRRRRRRCNTRLGDRRCPKFLRPVPHSRTPAGPVRMLLSASYIYLTQHTVHRNTTGSRVQWFFFLQFFTFFYPLPSIVMYSGRIRNAGRLNCTGRLEQTAEFPTVVSKSTFHYIIIINRAYNAILF